METILVHPLPGGRQRTQARIVLALALACFVAATLWTAVTLGGNPGRLANLRNMKWPDVLWRTMPAFIYLAVALVFRPILSRARRDARLILSADGLEHRSGLPARFPALMPGVDNWKLRWSEIGRVRYMRNMRNLYLEPKNGRPIGIPLRDWVEQGIGAPAVHPEADHPLWCELQARGLLHLPEGNFDSNITFELDRHPATRWALAAGAALALYGFADVAFNPECYLHPENSYGFLLPALSIGLMTGVIAALWLRRAPGPIAVPHGVALGMGAMLWIAGTVAGYSAMLRINQLYGGPLVQEPYRREANCTVLQPRNRALATIEFKPSTREHWCAFATDQDIPVPVRRGLFGIYQAKLVGLADNTTPTRDGNANSAH